MPIPEQVAALKEKNEVEQKIQHLSAYIMKQVAALKQEKNEVEQKIQNLQMEQVADLKEGKDRQKDEAEQNT